ncbi:MAG: hypothetical protein NTX43_03340 [Bacteroidetes bacterium]|nr:hypothetical protein [Bacteroidota bacterium]
MKLIYRFTPEIIVLLYIFLFFGFKSPEKPWDRVINSDGKAYYAYLPAIFIHQDLQYRFVENYEYVYYPRDKSSFKEFRMKAGDGVVNKTFPGMAVVWAPFFLFAHFVAYLELYPADGYSPPYQYMIALASLFFLWLGARTLMRLLIKFGSSEKNAAFISAVIALGTNLVYYTITEGSMTHVYSFALITSFLLAIYNLTHTVKTKWFGISIFILALIILIRPTNALVILLIPFVTGSRQRLTNTIVRLLAAKSSVITGLVIFLLLMFIPFLLWKLQSGSWVVYSYGDEGFYFLNPYFFSILGSYNRGWFIYTPVAFVSMFGFIGLYRKSWFHAVVLFIFLVFFIYLASSWWVWYYASKCGQRVFIDIYAVVGLLLVFLYGNFRSVTVRRAITVLLIALSALNIFQYYQHTKWIYPPYIITSGIFWDSFFSTEKKAKAYIPKEAIVSERSFTNDMEKEMPWMNNKSRTNLVSYSGSWSSRADTSLPYSSGMEVKPDSLFTTANRVILVTAMVLSPRERTDATLVVDFSLKGRGISYNPFYLLKFIKPDEWVKVEVAYYVPSGLPKDAIAKVYFFNPAKYLPIFIDDMKVDYISLKNITDYRRIEGIVLPAH